MLQLQAAPERVKRKTNLQESEERYRSLAHVAFDGVAVHFDGILLQVTQPFDRLFGYAFGETLGMSIDDLVIEDQRDYFRRELEKGSVFELECLREDGRHIHVEASTCACTFKGEPAHLLAVRDISARKREQQAARHQADYDSLTGLPNRLLFYDRLCVAIEQAAREGRRLAVMFLDLDRFKNVNDALGHNIGDVLLFEVAERLTACLGDRGTASRLGGDEFTVLLQELADPADAVALADRIVKSVNRPYVILGQSVSVGVSVGIAMYPEHGQQADSLIRAADAAMYHAKDAGRNNYQLYGPEKAGKQDKLGLENRLRKGIEDKEFVVYYQPKMDLETGGLEGAEA
ncbi:MAG TPA: diguanylate cyclase, partial [bacterium]|nr:diguanylate cyclase [bacterium]